MAAADASMAEALLSLSIKYSSLPIGSTHWVYVTHITDPNDFFVRPAVYGEYLKRLKRYGGPANPTELELGSTVIYKPETKNHHVRASITNVRVDNGKAVYDLFALDYGFFEASVSIDRIKKPYGYASFPPTVIHCTLADCVPKGGMTFDEKAIDAMVYYIGTDKVRMVVRSKMGSNKYLVELYDSNPDVATLMALSGYTCLGYDSNAISRMPTVSQPRLFFTHKQLKLGDTLKVRVQSGDSLKSFYVCDTEDFKYYLQEYRKTQCIRNERDLPPEELRQGRGIGVYSNWYGSYERAVVTRVTDPDKSALVQLVDWGVTMDVHVGMTKLKSISRENYFALPPLAIYCTAVENQVFDNALHRVLHPGCEIMITVTKIGKEFETPYTVRVTKTPNCGIR